MNLSIEAKIRGLLGKRGRDRLNKSSREIINHLRQEEGRYKFFKVKKEEPFYLTLTKKRLSLEETPYFEKELLNYTRCYDGDIIFDLRNLDFLDCSGVAALIKAHKKEIDKAHKLILIWPSAPNNSAKRYFEICRGEEIITNWRLKDSKLVQPV